MADPYDDLSGIVPNATTYGSASGLRALAQWCATPVRPRHIGHRYSPPVAWMWWRGLRQHLLCSQVEVWRQLGGRLLWSSSHD